MTAQQDLSCPYPTATRDWEPTPDILKKLVDHPQRTLTDFDSKQLRHWVMLWYWRLQDDHPEQLQNFGTKAFWDAVKEDDEEITQGQPLDDGEEDVEPAKQPFKPLSACLTQTRYRIVGFGKKSAVAGSVPKRGTIPVKEEKCDGWYLCSSQAQAFQRIRKAIKDWAGLDVWVEITTRRIDICDDEVDRRCENYWKRISTRTELSPQHRARLIHEYERNLNKLLNGRMTAVYHFPDSKKSFVYDWNKAGHSEI